MKPFAVLMRDMETVRRECEVPPEAEEILTGHQKPIVLLPRIPGGSVCEETAPDNLKIGVMLPYAPIHLLLFHYDDGIEMPDCLIMTSGNVSGAPICRDDAEAEEELGNLADAILSHNRKIRIRADDSVMDIFDGKPYMIRRSRGYAPLPFILGEAFDAPVIGIGGELKNTFCVGRGGIFYPSPYIGDMEDIRTYAALTETVGRFTKLLEAKPEVCAADLHPRYHSAEAAESLGLPVVRIQHHYAHILSCMAENEHTSPVIGLSFDGTGYGTDGTIWGGEVLLADFEGFERRGHIRPFLMTGGDAAAREGWRVAVTMLGALYKDNSVDIIQKLGIAEPSPARTILMMAGRGLNTVTSTSAGRLFDAASAVLGLRRASTFEGEASMALEFAAGRYAEKEREPAEWGRVSFSEENPIVLPTDELIKRLAEGRLAGEDTDKLAYIFHEGLAEMAAAAAEIAGETGIRTAALSGGCFQNLLLTRLTAEKLKKRGFCVLLHSQIPPNDGGIALGQAAAAAFRIHKQNQ
jgi:hydrogenase maturation protein HypF